MQWPSHRSVAVALVAGVLAGGTLALYVRLAGSPVGMGGGAGSRGFVAIGSPAGGGGWITLYSGTDHDPYARTRVPWQEYDDAVGGARPIPLRLARGEQKIVVGLDAMPGQTGGWIVVLDGPAGRCKPLAWRRVVLGGARGGQSLWAAGGDIDGDGLDEVAVGSPQANGEVVVLDDLEHGLAPLATLKVPWETYNEECGETRPAVGDVDGDGKAEVVVGLGPWGGRADWVAVYKDLRLAKWVGFPESKHDWRGDGTWPAVDADGDLLIGTDSGLQARIAIVADPLGAAPVGWVGIPAEVARTAATLRPLCLDLEGGATRHLLATLPDSPDAALFDDASRGRAFLGWRRGIAPPKRPAQAAVATHPGSEGRERALAALRARQGEVDVTRGDDGTPQALVGELSAPSDKPPVERAEAFLRENTAIWGITDPSLGLALDKERSVLELDECKTTHVRFQQLVSGVPLLDRQLAIHMDATGVVTFVTADLDPLAAGEEVNPVPGVTKEAAAEIVKREARATLVADPQPRLVAWRGNDPVHLAWQAEVTSLEGRFGREYLIDAHSGKVLTAVERGRSDGWAPARAVGHTRGTMGGANAGGNDVRLHISAFHRDVSGTDVIVTYEFMDQRRNARLYTGPGSSAICIPFTHQVVGRTYHDQDGVLREFTFDGEAVVFPDWAQPDTTQGGGLLVAEGVAAHRNMGKVLTYWYDHMHRNSWDGANADVWVDLDWTAEDCDSWLGDGFISVGHPNRTHTQTALDTLAHEFTHGVVQTTMHLDFGGETGALNEHIADAFAEFTEYRVLSETEDRGQDDANAMADPRPGIWTFESEVGFASHMRDFRQEFDCLNFDPPTPPYTLDNDYGHIHQNARILDYWLYLWVRGGEHEWVRNGRERGVARVTGMVPSGMPESQAVSLAEQCYYRLLMDYPASRMGFKFFRTAMMQSIQGVCGADSVAAQEAERAFRAILLWPPYPGPAHTVASPAPGTTLTSSNVNFTWDAVPGATAYALSVGTTAGGSNLFARELGTGVSTSVSGLPTNGETLYVRFSYRCDGEWYYNDVTYTAATAEPGGEAPVITSPVPGSTLASSSATIAWRAGAGVTRYVLYVGTRLGARDVLLRDAGQGLSASVWGLPTNGQTLYVRLWYRVGTAWRYVDVTYAAARAGGGAGTPSITSPAPGSVLASSTATFTWSAGASWYWLTIGSTAGGRDLYNVEQRTNLSATVSGLPTNGSTLYVLLWYRSNGTWYHSDITCTAVNQGGGGGGQNSTPPVLTSPSPGSTLTSSIVTFTWTPGSGNERYWFKIGSAPGGRDLGETNLMTEASVQVLDLPTDGRTLYVRLSYMVAGTWLFVDATYTAFTGAPAPPTLWNPRPGSTLTSSTVTFSWTPGRNVSQYWLCIGSSPGGRDLLNWNAGPLRELSVSGLPTDGRRLYVRIYSRSGATAPWQYTAANYTAAQSGGSGGGGGGSGGTPVLTDPAPGSKIWAFNVQFRWTAGTGFNRYWLQVGRNVGGNTIYDADVGSNRSALFMGIPGGGGPIYVRLWYKGDGPWRYTDWTVRTWDYGPPVFLLQPQGQILRDPSVDFIWQGVDIQRYRLCAGTTLGGNDLFDGPGVNGAATVTGVPNDGRPLYVRLWWDAGNGWNYTDVRYDTGQ